MESRWLVTGATGWLGGWLLRRLRSEGATVVAWAHRDRDGAQGVALEDKEAVERALDRASPTHVIHAGAMAAVAACASEPDRALAVNAHASELIAHWCAAHDGKMVHISTDLVFDGEHAPYDERAEPRPTTSYGRSKHAAEPLVLAHGATVARIALLFGPSVNDRLGFFDRQLAALRNKQTATYFEDEWRTPLAIDEAADALVTLARAPAGGIVHLAGPQRLSRLEMGYALAEAFGLDRSCIVPGSRTSIGGEPRPRDTSLSSIYREQPWVTHTSKRSFGAACRTMQEIAARA